MTWYDLIALTNEVIVVTRGVKFTVIHLSSYSSRIPHAGHSRCWPYRCFCLTCEVCTTSTTYEVCTTTSTTTAATVASTVACSILRHSVVHCNGVSDPRVSRNRFDRLVVFVTTTHVVVVVEGGRMKVRSLTYRLLSFGLRSTWCLNFLCRKSRFLDLFRISLRWRNRFLDFLRIRLWRLLFLFLRRVFWWWVWFVGFILLRL